MVVRKYDAYHDFHGSFSMYIRDSLSTRSSTIIPIIMNDDERGDPMDFNANPEHSAWVEVSKPNCFPDSEIRSMKMTLRIIVAKGTASQSSNFDIEYALISCAFPEDLDALDEKSGLTFKEVLELQKEATDRQTYPLWSAIDMTDASILSTGIPGLTASQAIEGVNFDKEVLMDQLRYGKIKGLLKKCLPIGYRRTTLRAGTTTGFTKKLTFNFVPRNAKFINQYTFLGLLVRVPQASTISTLDISVDQPVDQATIAADSEKIIFAWNIEYNERNPEFHMAKV